MYWFTKARVSSRMILDKTFMPGILLATYRLLTEPELTGMEIMNTTLAAAGFIHIAEVLMKIVKKLRGGAPEEPDSPEDVGDIDALLATLSGIAVTSTYTHANPVDNVLEVGSIAMTYLYFKGLATGAPDIMFNPDDNQPVLPVARPRPIG